MGLLGKNEVAEIFKLVAMFHTYYQFSAIGGTVSDNNNHQQHHQQYGYSSMCQHENNTFATTMANDDWEQTFDILHELIPIYGKGDPSIDKLVKKNIERLPKQVFLNCFPYFLPKEVIQMLRIMMEQRVSYFLLFRYIISRKSQGLFVYTHFLGE